MQEGVLPHGVKISDSDGDVRFDQVILADCYPQFRVVFDQLINTLQMCILGKLRNYPSLFDNPGSFYLILGEGGADVISYEVFEV